MLGLGIDTGGTYTDAVLIKDNRTLIAKAKSLTTRPDLSLGIGASVDEILQRSGVIGSSVDFVSLSTTLATNALIEGHGGRVALILIGFSDKDFHRQDLGQALGTDRVIFIDGGHAHDGAPRAAFGAAALRKALSQEDTKGISAFAVAGQFATRNPAHELEAKALIRDLTGRPVTCSHELSSKLGGPKRAMTALLNARLIGLISELITSAEAYLISKNISAPLMVVRGDGALIPAALAKEKPIETILSGPAASVVGANWLSPQPVALISDIGGTTTDIALLKDGRPKIDPEGAKLGGLRTMVEAVAMYTWGLGGDSEVSFNAKGLKGELFLGPKRLCPISLFAMEAPELVHEKLDAVLRAGRIGEFDLEFLKPLKPLEAGSGLDARAREVFSRISKPMPLADAVKIRMDGASIDHLVARGFIQRAGLTPSDAAHVLGLSEAWNADAARLALSAFSLQRSGSGAPLAASAKDLAQRIIDQLVDQTSQYLLSAAFTEEERDDPDALSSHALAQDGMRQHAAISKLHVGLAVPIVGLGASAHVYYGAVGERLSTEAHLPKDGDVANAIGAAVGLISFSKDGSILRDAPNLFRLHHDGGVVTIEGQDAALSEMIAILKRSVEGMFEGLNVENTTFQIDQKIDQAEIDGDETLIEARIRVIGRGRPRAIQKESFE